MRTIPISLKIDDTEKTYHLRYDVEAMLIINELASLDELCEAVFVENEDGKKLLDKTLVILSEQGELARRYYGYDRAEMLTEKELSEIKGALNISALRYAAMLAISDGSNGEKDDSNEPVDLGLREIQSKKSKELKRQKMSRAQLLLMGAFCGKSEKETLLCRPCVLLKQYEIARESNKINL